jgi:hypothetical protein
MTPGAAYLLLPARIRARRGPHGRRRPRPWARRAINRTLFPTLRRRVLAKRATAMVRGVKILLAFGYAENAFNHNGRFDPGVKLLSMIATSLLVSSAGC